MALRLVPNDPPREFEAGGVRLRDCGRILLEPDEQVTFTTEDGAEHDVARKEWGFYATPSLNARLPALGLRPVLVASPAGRYYLLLVETGKEQAFEEYAREQGLAVVARLDDVEVLRRLEGGS